MAPGRTERVHFEHFCALATKCAREDLKQFVLKILCLDHQMAAGGSQTRDFKHFCALTTKCCQEAPKQLILYICVPWPPNAPRKLRTNHFEHFGIGIATLMDLSHFFDQGCHLNQFVVEFLDQGCHHNRFYGWGNPKHSKNTGKA